MVQIQISNEFRGSYMIGRVLASEISDANW
jgi:hypothetical protein